MNHVILIASVCVMAASAVVAQDLSVTVYNQNLALVKEVRTVEIAKGKTRIDFPRVASQIDPTSVHLKSLTSPDRLAILEQNYEYDLVDAQKILQKYLDREIDLVTEKGTFQGILLNASDSEVVLKEKDGRIRILRGEQVADYHLGELPEGLITRPTLFWLVDNGGPSKQAIELSYMTQGMTWHAEYVAAADAEDKQLELSGWISLENQSGAAYENALLKLVAGDVHRAEESIQAYGTGKKMLGDAAEAEPQFEEKSFFEYHLYTLNRRATLKDNETKQISLFSSARTDVDKVYLYDGARYDQKVRVYFEFRNAKNKGLGMPLPNGKVRVYKADTDGALEFIGEDRIDHVPVDEKVRIFLGNAFDIVGERAQKSIEKVDRRSQKVSVEVTLRNHKKSDVQVLVAEHLWGDWQIIEKTHEYKRKDSGTAEFTVPVPAGAESVLRYTALITW